MNQTNDVRNLLQTSQTRTALDRSNLSAGELPIVPSGFWNRDDPDLARLSLRFQANRLPRVCLIHGPLGSGGSTVAQFFGLWSSCEALQELGEPCLCCRSCRAVITSPNDWRGRFYHMRVVQGKAVADFGYAQDQLSFEVPRPLSELGLPSVPRPPCLVLDRIDHASPREQFEIASEIERDNRILFVMVAKDLALVVDELKALTKGAIYGLKLPSMAIVEDKLMAIAAAGGRRISRKLANAIAVKAGRQPQACLGLLDDVMLDPTIDEDRWIVSLSGKR